MASGQGARLPLQTMASDNFAGVREPIAIRAEEGGPGQRGNGGWVCHKMVSRLKEKSW